MAASLMVLTSVFFAYAQTEQDAGYDQNIEVSFSGTVSAVSEEAPLMQGRSGFMRKRPPRQQILLTVKSSGRVYQVITGPAWFMRKKNIAFAAGDEVNVTGAKVFGRDGNLYIITRHISIPSTGASIALRDSMGRPAWRRHSQ